MEWLEFIFLVIGSYYDIREQRVPILLFAVFGSIALIGRVLLVSAQPLNVLIGMGVGGLLLIISRMTGEVIGYGDGMAVVVLGIFEGWRELIFVLAGAFVLCGIYGLWKLLGLKCGEEETMPFFPFLLISRIGMWLL